MKSNATQRLIITILIAFFATPPLLLSQDDIECPDHLEFCYKGWNKLYMEEDPGPSVLYFKFGLGGSSSYSTHYEYPYYYFLIDYHVPVYGDYRLYSYTTSQDLCSGTYSTYNCHDYLLFERENTCGLIIYFKPTNPYEVFHNTDPYEVCLGDTTPIYISPRTYQSTDLPNAPLTADRLNIKNGYLIDIEEYSAKIVWTAVGSDEVELITTDECGFQWSTKQEFVVVETNEMNIIAEGNSSVINVCVDESVILDSDIGEAYSIIWKVSDGRTFTDKEIDLAFDIPGQYTVTLEDPDKCNCSESDVITINVLTGGSPQITCIGTICENTSVTYYSEDFCDSYLWSISSNGTITDGGGSEDYYISVDWGVGPEGTVELETPGCYATPCRENVVARIPIISSNTNIDGPSDACAGQRYSYSLPDYAGTTFTWSATHLESGESTGSMTGQGTNKISIGFATSFQEQLVLIEVEYENCTLGCDGRAELLVRILPRFNISAVNSFICVEDWIQVVEENYLPLDYEVLSPSGGLTNYSSVSNLYFEGTEEGEYLITATNPNNNTCNQSEEVKVVVSGIPELPSAISNDGVVCKGENSTFYIDGLPPNHSVLWKVYDGNLVTPTLELTSKTLHYVWTYDEPYQIEAHLVDIQTGCIGESISQAYSTSIEVTGDDEICKLLEGNYSISNADNLNVLWTLLPDSAGVIVSQSNNDLSVVWSEEGTHSIIGQACGITTTFSVDVVNYELDLVYPDSVCIGDQGTVQVNAPIGSSIDFFDENDIYIASGSEVMLGKGEYSVVVNTPSNCIDGGVFSIGEYEEFEVRISADGSTSFCLPASPINLISSAPPGTYTYEWYKDNVLLSETSSILSTNEYGLYFVIATNEHGCKDQSNKIRLYECCGDSFTDCTTNVFEINVTDVDCYEKEFEITNSFESDTIRWDFGDFGSASNIAYGNMVSHVFSGVGIFVVTVNGNKGCNEGSIALCGIEEPVVCCESGQAVIIIYTMADFEVEETCVGVPIVLNNETKKIDGYTGESYSWDLGDPSSSDNFSTDEEPTHIYNTAGNYMITLEVTDHLGCRSTAIKEVIVHPKPIVDISIPDKGCKGINVSFETSTTFANVKYEWDFGDENSGYYNKSKESNPTHLFAKEGTYMINLRVESEQGCIEHYTQNIDIVFETNLGEITSANGFYKCPGESIELIAPEGKSYLWSTTEVSQSINVTEVGEYEVIVESNSGCQFKPNIAVVSDIDLTQLRIYGSTREDGVGAVLHYDSMEVCNDEYFVLNAQKYQDVIFTWSIDNIEAPNLRYHEDGLADLDAGRHEVTVTARHSVLGCEVELEPFIINIVEEPEEPIIVSSAPNICIGGNTTLSVVDPISDYIYVWNNGQIGTSIVAISNGNNYVYAISPEGCQSQISNKLYVRSNPRSSPWVGGCHEVCFPFTVCTNLYQAYTYQLIRNESDFIPVDSSSPEIVISEPGDYELIAISSSGCRSKSELLSLSAMPEDQGLSGIVYFDQNANGTFEVTDTLLENIPVILCNGNTPVDTTITDVNGSYAFMNLPYPNLIAKIDLSNTPYASEGSLDTLIVFSECIEFKELDFPVISHCLSSTFEESFYVCEGNTIVIDGIEYTAGHKDTLVYAKEGICDSIVYLSVENFTIPDIDLTMTETCIDLHSGMLSINSHPEDSLLFRMDEDAAWSTDTLFDHLGEGNYEVFVLSKFGCITNQTFEIVAFPIPELEITTTSSCLDTNNGEVEFNTDSPGVLFAIDDSFIFDSLTHYENLAIGTHTVDFLDENGCLHLETFEILPNVEPEVNLSTVSTCPELNGGSLNIDVLLGENLSFSIDGGSNFSSQTEFNDLEDGSYILDIRDEHSCMYQRAFEIEQYPETSFEINTSPACNELETGSLIVFNASAGLQFQIDGSNWTQDLFFDGLSVGQHQIYSQSAEGCFDTLSFIIELVEEPILNFDVTPGCEGILGGTLNIDLNEELTIALDSGQFGNQVVFNDITPGAHVFHAMNEFGCIYDYPFNVVEVVMPEIEIVTKPSCFEMANGSATLMEDSTFEVAIFDFNGEEIEDLDGMFPGEYTALATNDYNCEYSYPFTILEQEEPYLSATLENSCFGEEGGSIFIDERSPNSLISINGEEFIDASSFENLSAGIYEIQIIDSLLCSSIIELEIESFDELIVEVPIESGECFGSPVLIVPEVKSFHGELEFLWSDGSTDSQKMAGASEMVSLVVSDYCTSKTFEFDIEIANELTEELVYIPNVFSPNGDDVNDCFQVTVDASISLATYRQMIFDRWGNKLFESNDIDYCWNGLFNDRDLEEGVYVYIVEATGFLCEGEKKIRKVGDVTIIK